MQLIITLRLLLALALLFPFAALAHMVSISTGDLKVEGKIARYELRMPQYEVEYIKEPQTALFRHFKISSAGSPGRPPHTEIRTA